MDKLNNRVKELAKQKGVSVRHILESLEINPGFFTDLNRKKTAPSVDKIIKLADYFNVSTDYLLGLTDNPSPYEAKKRHPISISEQDAQRIYDKLVELGIFKPGEKLTKKKLDILEETLISQAEFIRYKLESQK